MRLALFTVALAFGLIVLPVWWDAADRAHASLRMSRAAPRRETAGPARDAARLAHLSDALALSRPLAASLRSLSDLAARSRLAFTTLAVHPPTEPVTGLSEYRVKVAVTGAAADVRRYLAALPDVEAPLALEAARLTGARLELDLRALEER